MQEVTVTDLRKFLRNFIDDFMAGCQPLLVIRNDKPVAVMISYSDYQALIAELTKDEPPPKQPAPIHW